MSDEHAKAIYSFNDMVERSYAAGERSGLTKDDMVKELRYIADQWEQDDE